MDDDTEMDEEVMELKKMICKPMGDMDRMNDNANEGMGYGMDEGKGE